MSDTKHKLTETIVQSMEDIKSVDVIVLDVSNITSITDQMIITSGTSSQHVKAIANKVMEDTKKTGFKVIGIEGMDQGQWVLIDFGDAIAHIMHPDSRNYYQLEKLWSVETRDIGEQA